MDLDPFNWKLRLRHSSGRGDDNNDAALYTMPRGAAKRKPGAGATVVMATGLKVSTAVSTVSTPVSVTSSSVAVTSQPSNDSELQLYRVLQRANLLTYYDVFIAQGGDDVHQLIEAGEEEFLEIMALVGMASKPLHVRRLQKALHEWAQNPGLFQTPLVPISNYTAPTGAAAVIRSANCTTSVSSTPPVHPSHTLSSSAAASSAISAQPISSTRPSPPPASVASTNHSRASASPSHSPSPLSKDVGPAHTSVGSPGASGGGGGAGCGSGGAVGGVPSPAYSQGGSVGGSDYPSLSTSPLQLTPVLVESQIQRISDTAAELAKNLPPLVEIKQPANKKKINKELEFLMSMTEDDPRKMDEIRKFSAIYGRFDCKRKPEKPLTLHEVSVNEAAAQLCKLVPALLTRRDELFPLARQVVRDSGYQYSKGHSRSQFIAGFPSKLYQSGSNGSGAGSHFDGDSNSRDSTTNGSPRKRFRLSSDLSEEAMAARRKIDQISEELRHLGDQLESLQAASKRARDAGEMPLFHQLTQQIDLLTSKHTQLAQEQQEYTKYLRARFSSGARTSVSSDPDRPDTDDDSQLSYSNASSPSGSQHAGSYVLSAASGGQIIAVQNPALNMSNALALAARSSASAIAPSTTVTSNNSSPSLLNLSQKPADKTNNENSGSIADTFKQEPASPPPRPLNSASSDKD